MAESRRRERNSANGTANSALPIRSRTFACFATPRITPRREPCCGTFRSKSFSPSHGFSHLTGFLLGRQTPGLIRYRQGALRTC